MAAVNADGWSRRVAAQRGFRGGRGFDGGELEVLHVQVAPQVDARGGAGIPRVRHSAPHRERVRMSRPLAYCTNSSQSNPTLTFRLASKPLVLRLERLDLRPELTPVVLDLGELLEVSLERTVVLSRHVLRQAEERDRGDAEREELPADVRPFPSLRRTVVAPVPAPAAGGPPWCAPRGARNHVVFRLVHGRRPRPRQLRGKCTGLHGRSPLRRPPKIRRATTRHAHAARGCDRGARGALGARDRPGRARLQGERLQEMRHVILLQTPPRSTRGRHARDLLDRRAVGAHRGRRGMGRRPRRGR